MMERFILIGITALALAACNGGAGDSITTDIINNPQTASGQIDTANLPVMQFETEVHDFGQITQGEKVNYAYTFTNSGKSDLIITSAKGSCGCTVPEWPKKPIAPGEKAVIDVVFDSNGKKGQQHKRITVVANTQPSTNVIALKGQVIAPETEG